MGEQVKKFLRTLVAIQTIAFTGYTIMRYVGDYRRHSTHDEHNQRCNCLSSCFRCAFEAALGA